MTAVSGKVSEIRWCVNKQFLKSYTRKLVLIFYNAFHYFRTPTENAQKGTTTYGISELQFQTSAYY
jgi:hypothetical protein